MDFHKYEETIVAYSVQLEKYLATSLVDGGVSKSYIHWMVRLIVPSPFESTFSRPSEKIRYISAVHRPIPFKAISLAMISSFVRDENLSKFILPATISDANILCTLPYDLIDLFLEEYYRLLIRWHQALHGLKYCKSAAKWFHGPCHLFAAL